MKPVETEHLNESSTVVSYKSKIDPPSTTTPQKPTKLEEASTEFWQAIKTVIALQNQAPPLQPILRNEDLPLSFSQERLWFLNQLKPDSSSHNIPLALSIQGLLNVPALEQSLNEILRRHETLRTTFTAVDGQPVQVINPIFDFRLPILDFTTIENSKAKVKNFLLEEVKRPFDLNQEPLLRATLLQLGEEEHVLLLTIHQVVFDGWSEGVLFRELAALYEAFSTEQPSPLPELPIQYADFAVWQRKWLQGEFLDTLLSYWKQQLGDSLPAQQLPIDRPRPVAPTQRSAHQTLVLSKELTNTLRTLSRQEGATLFTMLLAAFKVLLHRYTAQDDLFVCSPTANRNRSQTKGLIGYFVNLLVLRTNLSGNPSFRELLGRVRQAASGAYAHQDLPVQQLVNSLNLVNTPLSQVMFVLQNVPKQPLKLSGLTVSSLDIENGTADFDLSLSMVEGAEELTGVLKYNTDLFDEATITQMLSDYQTLLEDIVANPEQSISSLLPLVVTRSGFPVPNQESIAQDREFVAPRNPLELQLTEIWQEVLGIQSIGVRDNFFDLGGHSLLAVNLFTQIKEVFGKNLPLASLFQAPTVEQQVNLIRQEEGSAPWRSLVAIKPSGSKPPLFCVHGALGNVLNFQNLASYLDSDQPFYALQSQGLDGKQPPYTKIEDMAAHYLREIRTIQPEGPYFLGGFSFGGLVAFEMAQQLQAQGQKVALLAFLDAISVSYFLQGRIHEWVFMHLGKLLQHGPDYILDLVKWKIRQKLGIAQWTSNYGIKETLLKIAKEKLRKNDNKSSDLGNKPVSLSAAQAVEDANLQATKKYRPQVYSGRVTYFRASEEPVDGKWYIDPQLGWSRLVTGGWETYDVPGEHKSILLEPYVQTLVEKLRPCLDEAQRNALSVDNS